LYDITIDDHFSSVSGLLRVEKILNP